jgi:cell division protein FtsI (penicillin-binding protein 3)
MQETLPYDETQAEAPVEYRPEAMTEAPVAAPRRRTFLKRHLHALFSTRIDKSAGRILLVMLAFVIGYGIMIGRLVHFGLNPDDLVTASRAAKGEIATARPVILDRNGEILATDIGTVSVFAEPRRIVDRDEAAEAINSVFPELNGKELREKLSSKKGFIWIKREINPRQQEELYRLGVPGVGFLPENKRVYPNGAIGAHVLGAVNIDNVGIAGIEKWIDNQGLNDLRKLGFPTDSTHLKPVRLSLDLRVTHAMREELSWALTHFKAKAAAGAIMDVNTGEVISLVSLPDFDPNNPADALKPENINRMTVGVYEMGSTFKALTTAMVLDSGKAGINTTFDTRGGVLRYGRQVIHEYHGTNRLLTVPEVFLHSSNIGSAREALLVGVEGHKAFLKKMGLLDRMVTELPESAEPIVPKRWTEINTITIAFGHGIAVAPLQAAAAVAALLNGGHLVKTTFLKQDDTKPIYGPQVIKPETSEALRYIMRLNAEKGSARKADVPGYYVGGKTGTAEKVFNGRYVHNRLFTTFMAVIPADKPRYLFITTMDEPQGLPETYGYATAAWNAGVATGRIIERVGPMLDVRPRFDPPVRPFPEMVRIGAWGTH